MMCYAVSFQVCYEIIYKIDGWSTGYVTAINQRYGTNNLLMINMVVHGSIFTKFTQFINKSGTLLVCLIHLRCSLMCIYFIMFLYLSVMFNCLTVKLIKNSYLVDENMTIS